MSTQPSIPSPPATGGLQVRQAVRTPRRFVPMARRDAAQRYIALFSTWAALYPLLMREGAVEAESVARRNMCRFATEQRVLAFAEACWCLWAQRDMGVKARRARMIEVREELVRLGWCEASAWREACALAEVVG